ncbi:hypothetical protein RUM44_008709 [Polyplax serrata]|uniref:Uncharacterized protein n=1 Tax=Polyplax serrata TaxID=468196 RepID=A0ABR1BB61_POLSC
MEDSVGWQQQRRTKSTLNFIKNRKQTTFRFVSGVRRFLVLFWGKGQEPGDRESGRGRDRMRISEVVIPRGRLNWFNLGVEGRLEGRKETTGNLQNEVKSEIVEVLGLLLNENKRKENKRKFALRKCLFSCETKLELLETSELSFSRRKIATRSSIRWEDMKTKFLFIGLKMRKKMYMEKIHDEILIEIFNPFPELQSAEGVLNGL